MSLDPVRTREAVRRLLRAPRVPLARRLDELREILEDGAAPTIATAYFDAFLVTDGAFFDAGRPLLASPALEALRRVVAALVPSERLGDLEETVQLRALELPSARFWHSPVRLPGYLGTAFGFYGGRALLSLWQLDACTSRYVPFPCPPVGPGHVALDSLGGAPYATGISRHSVGGSPSSVPTRSMGRGASPASSLAGLSHRRA
jgi:hypothetical protein